MTSRTDAPLTYSKGSPLKKVSASKLEASNQATTTRKGATVFNSLFNDFVTRLYSEKGAYMYLVKTLPWKIHPKLLISFRELLPRESGKVSDNIRRVSVAAIPTFPSRDRAMWDGVEYLKIVFVHVAELAKAGIDEILYVAQRARTRILSHRQHEVTDTCVVVIADKQEKAANTILQAKARIRSANGSRIAYVFSAGRGPYIRKLLFGFLGNYLTKRAEKVEEDGNAALAARGTDRTIYGDLKDCCDFVAGLGRKLHDLAGEIKLAWGARKTNAEYYRDKLASELQMRPREEEEAAARAKMRELDQAAMAARRDRGRSPLIVGKAERT